MSIEPLMLIKSKGRKFRLFGPWIFFICLLVIGLFTGKQALKRYRIQQEIDAIRNEVAELDQRNSNLGQLLQYVQSPAYTEEQARLQFGFAKPGEKLAIIPEGAVLGEATDNRQDNNSRSLDESNPAKWWRYFFHP